MSSFDGICTGYILHFDHLNVRHDVRVPVRRHDFAVALFDHPCNSAC